MKYMKNIIEILRIELFKGIYNQLVYSFTGKNSVEERKCTVPFKYIISIFFYKY